MKQFNRSCLAVAVILCSTFAWAEPSAISDNIREEARLSKWSRAIAANDYSFTIEESQIARQSCLTNSCTTDFDMFLQALTEAYDGQAITVSQLRHWVAFAESQPLAVEEKAQVAWTFKVQLPDSWAYAKSNLEISHNMNFGENESPRFEQMLSYVDDREDFVTVPIDANRIQLAHDLVTQNPPIDKYGDGRYAKGVRIYMFCRDDRHYKCLMVMRNSQGAFVKVGGQYWTHPGLGYSRIGRKFDQTNGNTPMGVFLLEGVMPRTDQQRLFGKYRRFVLNLPSRSTNEEKFKMLLPVSSHTANWWNEGRIARNLGRGSFRVHGTLRAAPKGTPYFPFLGTGGCIAQRENTYEGVTYKDQRNLLDDVMKALSLNPVYANETSIRGLIYVMNIDATKRSVELADLVKLGILP